MNINEFVMMFKGVLFKLKDPIELEGGTTYEKASSGKDMRAKFLFYQLLKAEEKKNVEMLLPQKDSFRKYFSKTPMTTFLKNIYEYTDPSEFSKFIESLEPKQISLLRERIPGMAQDSSPKEVADAAAELFMTVFWESAQNEYEKAINNPNAKGSLLNEPTLCTAYSQERENIRRLFPTSVYFSPPKAALEELLENAFSESNVHVISGSRGIGKTELARYYARSCCGNQAVREEIQYNNVIWTTASTAGLRETIAQLPCSDQLQGDPFDARIKLLTRIRKPCLLIIDNYDNETSAFSELSQLSKEYQALIDTDCHILITSKVNLERCYAVRQSTLAPLPTAQLLALFHTLAPNLSSMSHNEKITRLIEDYLQKNTYLVVLAARLTQQKSLDEVLAAFRDLHVDEISESIPTDKIDSAHQYATLMDHYRIMFNMAQVQESPEKVCLLYNLALLPLEGMDDNDFIRTAFPNKHAKEYSKAFAELKDAFWVFHHNHMLWLHPLVRELVVTEFPNLKFEWIRAYVRSIGQAIHLEYYDHSLPMNLNYAISAYDICKRQNVRNFDIAYLSASIASALDTLHSNLASVYGEEAIAQLAPYLDLVQPPCTGPVKYDADQDTLAKRDVSQDAPEQDFRIVLSDCYNIAGYAILHGGTAYHREAAWSAFHIANSLAENAMKDDNTQWYASILRTKIQGNIAAVYVSRREYLNALDLHREQMLFRLALVEQDPSYKRLLAASYKGIATAHFYLSMSQEISEEKCLSLQSSLEYHRKSVDTYEEVFQKNSLEATIANNRMVGTGLTLLRQATNIPPQQMYLTFVDYLERMDVAAEYLGSLFSIDSEPKNCLTNTVNLTELILENDVNDRLVEKAFQIANKLRRFEEDGLEDMFRKLDHLKEKYFYKKEAEKTWVLQ